jgi:hypothetical protein
MCTPWTKKDLIRMSPETMLWNHIDSLKPKLPSFIETELQEQTPMYSAARIEKMCQWQYYQFEEWYYQEDYN